MPRPGDRLTGRSPLPGRTRTSGDPNDPRLRRSGAADLQPEELYAPPLGIDDNGRLTVFLGKGFTTDNNGELIIDQQTIQDVLDGNTTPTTTTGGGRPAEPSGGGTGGGGPTGPKSSGPTTQVVEQGGRRAINEEALPDDDIALRSRAYDPDFQRFNNDAARRPSLIKAIERGDNLDGAAVLTHRITSAKLPADLNAGSVLIDWDQNVVTEGTLFWHATDTTKLVATYPGLYEFQANVAAEETDPTEQLEVGIQFVHEGTALEYTRGIMSWPGSGVGSEYKSTFIRTLLRLRAGDEVQVQSVQMGAASATGVVQMIGIWSSYQARRIGD